MPDLRRLSARKVWGATGVALVAIAGTAVLVTATSDSTTVAGEPGSERISVQSGGGAAIGDQAPGFSATMINGVQVKLPAGKPTVLLFMATWCRPQVEATALDRLEREFGDRISVLGVDVDPKEPVADLKTFADSVDARYSYVHDTTGVLTTAYAVRAMDTTVVVDAGGRIVYRDGVPSDEATLRGALAAAGIAAGSGAS
jgi:peroxiredoxin